MTLTFPSPDPSGKLLNTRDADLICMQSCRLPVMSALKPRNGSLALTDYHFALVAFAEKLGVLQIMMEA